MQDLTDAIQSGELTEEQVGRAATALLDPDSDPNAKAAFLSALAGRGETHGEIAAFAQCFLNRALEPTIDRSSFDRPFLDVCGTGGDRMGLFNISTTAVFVLAACGVVVVKHGNRGVSSPTGGADVLEALGIRIDLPPEDFGRCLAEVGAGFLFAPLYHPAFKVIAPVRKRLAEEGRRTIFNLLGPLLNPVQPEYQLIGVFNPDLGQAFARILAQLGRRSAWVVHGMTRDGRGMDEISTLGPTRIWAVDRPDPVEFRIEPSQIGLSDAEIDELRGGQAAENASRIEAILNGRGTRSQREIVALNAAAGLVVTGIATDVQEGLAKAGEAIDSGAARAILKKWRNFV